MTATLKHFVITAVVIAGVLRASIPIAVAGGFLEKPRAAFAEARESRRPLLLEFHTSWCSSCERMQRTTWRDPRVVESMGSFVALSIDGERNRNLQARYSVGAYPTIVIANPEGRVILTLLGFQSESAMAGHLEEVLRDKERLGALAERAENDQPDPEAWLELAAFAHRRGALGQAEVLYRRTFARRRALTPELTARARIGLGGLLAETDRCREALRLVRDLAEDAAPVRERCAP